MGRFKNCEFEVPTRDWRALEKTAKERGVTTAEGIAGGVALLAIAWNFRRQGRKLRWLAPQSGESTEVFPQSR